MPKFSSASAASDTTDQIASHANATANICLDVEVGETCLGLHEDWAAIMEQAARAALGGSGVYAGQPAEIYIELVPSARSHELNKEYRGKDKPTNVLSFPGTEPDVLAAAFAFAEKGGPPVALGDLIIADAVVLQEASEQNKPVAHHLIHLVVHGVLHLLGYDHMIDHDAEKMETLEREILATLNVPDPYGENS
ncbi:MAG: rRNA maturation RNase YbeY [Kordiimonadaceae bacterium]|nr:rRNA maturation RNase YbeY [Kordiimonadaceae bacterium]